MSGGLEDETGYFIYGHKFRLLTSPHTFIHMAKEMHWQVWKGDDVHCKAGNVFHY